MRHIQLLAFLAFCSFATVAYASNVDRYKDVSSIPDVLLQSLKMDIFLEEYISTVLQIIRRNAADKVVLRSADIENVITKAVKREQEKRLQLLTRYDANKDDQIEITEVEAYFAKQKYGSSNSFKERKEFAIRRLISLDADVNGVVTYNELMDISKENQQKIYADYQIAIMENFLAIDPNKDNALTVDELKELSRKAFSTIDLNGNGQLSSEEHRILSQFFRSRSILKPTVGVYAPHTKKWPVPMKCHFTNFDQPKDLLVYATGVYGGRRINISIDQSGHEGRQVDVIVNETDKPVALILGAYEPTIWNIQHTPNTKIAAVFATGYHKQFVMGLDQETPVLLSSDDTKARCERMYFDEGNLKRLNPLAKRLFDKEVDVFFPVEHQSGRVVIGKPVFEASSLIRHGDLTAESFKLKNTLLSGSAGLKEAVSKGVIRVATTADIEMVYQLYVQKTLNDPNNDIPRIAGKTKEETIRGNINLPLGLSAGKAYVVLKPFHYPARLHGGHAPTFIIPIGVPRPKGDPGHSSVIDLNTGECLSPMCRFLERL